MSKINIENIIEKSIDYALEVLDFNNDKLEWDFDDGLIGTRIAMRYLCEYDLILINTELYSTFDEKFGVVNYPFVVMSKIWHEVYHSYQFHNDPDNFRKTKSFVELKEDYILQEKELEASAFENLILCHTLGLPLMILYDYPQEASIKIMELMKEMHGKYIDKIEDLIKERQD